MGRRSDSFFQILTNLESIVLLPRAYHHLTGSIVSEADPTYCGRSPSGALKVSFVTSDGSESFNIRAVVSHIWYSALRILA